MTADDRDLFCFLQKVVSHENENKTAKESCLVLVSTCILLVMQPTWLGWMSQPLTQSQSEGEDRNKNKIFSLAREVFCEAKMLQIIPPGSSRRSSKPLVGWEGGYRSPFFTTLDACGVWFSAPTTFRPLCPPWKNLCGCQWRMVKLCSR